MYHFDTDAVEHLHHKGNAMLQSQVWDLPNPDPVTLTAGHLDRECAAAGRNVRREKNLKHYALYIYWSGEAWTMFHMQAFNNIIVTIHKLKLTIYQLIN